MTVAVRESGTYRARHAAQRKPGRFSRLVTSARQMQPSHQGAAMISRKKKKKKDDSLERQLDLARNRVRKMTTHYLLEWADTAGSAMALAFSDYRREGEQTSLDEIKTATIALLAITDELSARDGAGLDDPM